MSCPEHLSAIGSNLTPIPVNPWLMNRYTHNRLNIISVVTQKKKHTQALYTKEKYT